MCRRWSDTTREAQVARAFVAPADSLPTAAVALLSALRPRSTVPIQPDTDGAGPLCRPVRSN